MFHRDVIVLWSLVFLRMMGYGLTNQVLTLFLQLVGVLAIGTGWFMTATLIGDSVLLLWLTWRADEIGRRRILVLGCVLMALSGVVFSRASNYWFLLAAAVFGVILPSGDETGPFKSVEEALLAHLTAPEQRAKIYAIHGLLATAGAALGSLVAGIVVDKLVLGYQFEAETAYRVVFAIYLAIGVTKGLLSLVLTKDCEVKGEVDPLVVVAAEDAPLLPTSSTGLSSRTLRLLAPLLAVFMLDSLGYGLMPWAWVVYYLKTAFAMLATSLGTLFFVINLVNAGLLVPLAWIATKLGNVSAILATQVPASVMFALILAMTAFAPTAALLLGYAATLTLDVVPRQMLLLALFPPNELAKVMGLVNLGKTAARSVGPPVTGFLASRQKLHWGFAINGGCVLVADAILWKYLKEYDEGEIH